MRVLAMREIALCVLTMREIALWASFLVGIVSCGPYPTHMHTLQHHALASGYAAMRWMWRGAVALAYLAYRSPLGTYLTAPLALIQTPT